jgi:flavorubredoxin
MKKAQTIFSEGSHKWIAIARDPERPHHLIDTNEYLVTKDNIGLICDPGGQEIFSAVFSAICEVFDPRNIEIIFASHQDPDIISSLAYWYTFNENIPCYTSGLWSTFIPHFGGNESTIRAIPDQGCEINVSDLILQAFPAHYLHSSGNFHLYDAKAKILFSGDVGAALLPNENSELFVTDFDKHIRFAEGFHKRWMGSETAKQNWCERASELKLDFMCPQHGAIYQEKDIERFIHWFSELKIGSGILD